MNTPRSFGSMACLIAAGALIFCAPGPGRVRAAGFGAISTAGGSGAANVGATTAGGTAGGHSASVSTNGAHAATVAVNHGSAVYHSSGTLRPITAIYSGPPRYLPGGFAPSAVNQTPVNNATIARASTALASVRPNATGEYSSRIAPAVRIYNAWTDPTTTATEHAVPSAHNGYRPTGTILYPNVPRDVLGSRNSPGNTSSTATYGRHHGYRFGHRGYYNAYAYSYPGVIFGGYNPDFYGGVGGAAGSVSDDTDSVANESPSGGISPSSVANTGSAGSYAAVPPYPPPTSPDANAEPADATSDGPPPGSGTPNLKSNVGPDSLVEAVQAELSRRGYFGGRIDAIYNEGTHAAIQRFQRDQHLPASGRINEATLHALQLD